MYRIYGLFLIAGVLAAQQPPIVNARLTTTPVNGSLENTIRAAVGAQAQAQWVGWAVPAPAGNGNTCCWNNNRHGCGLEGRSVESGVSVGNPGPVKLEGPTYMAILVRFENGSINRITALSTDCTVDVGGLALHWITGAQPAQSIAFLEQQVSDDRDRGHRNLADSALFAIAMHQGTEAEKSLAAFATSGNSVEIRKRAIFWLASQGGKFGYETVARAATQDPNDDVRQHSIFALTLSPEPGAIPAIIKIAHDDRSAHVRGQALFWLSQKASKEASAAINDAIDRDPDTEVKKKAVFALSQLPPDQGVPRLIEVARNNRNPAVRKQAMFWLGQSKDPRALQFFEQVLTK